MLPYVSLVLEKASHLRRLWKDAPVSIFALYGSENAGAAYFCNETDEVKKPVKMQSKIDEMWMN